MNFNWKRRGFQSGSCVHFQISQRPEENAYVDYLCLCNLEFCSNNHPYIRENIIQQYATVSLLQFSFEKILAVSFCQMYNINLKFKFNWRLVPIYGYYNTSFSLLVLNPSSPISQNKNLNIYFSLLWTLMQVRENC